jgi:putative ABC transport system ATP-binding protein
MDEFIRLQNLSKLYLQGQVERSVLRGASLTVAAGEFVSVRGRSGSGKSTLLNLLAGLDRPTQGEIFIDGVCLSRLTASQLTRFRRDSLGFVFQFFNLIPSLTVLENVLLPAELAGTQAAEAQRRARSLLERVGLADRGPSFPDRLSGGEQQRVALARALINEPRLILADEPTGNLDRATGDEVLAMLMRLARERGTTLLVATHSRRVASLADRHFSLEDGQFVPDRDLLLATQTGD